MLWLRLILSAVPVYAWNMPLGAPPTISDPKFQFPAFANDDVVLDKTIGRLPALGWNSWNAYASQINEGMIRAIADAFVARGLDKAGYEYVVIDDGCYPIERGSDGRLTNNENFSSGFKAMSNYVHGKSLKFGMYNCVGVVTCAGQAGLYGHEDLDAQSFASWDIDYIKIDYCGFPWDVGWKSAGGPNQQYVYAPRVKSITLSGGYLSTPMTLKAVSDGIHINWPYVDVQGDYVSRIGTDMSKYTNQYEAHQRVDRLHYHELAFEVDVPRDDTYNMVIRYSTGFPDPSSPDYPDETGHPVYDNSINRQGKWLQVAVGPVENEIRYFDNALAVTDSSPDTFTYRDSQTIKVGLKAGSNLLRLMNHRREENALYAYAAFRDGLNKAGVGSNMVLSVCDWGQNRPQSWAKKVGDSWRTSDDIALSVGVTGNASWGSGSPPSSMSIMGQYAKTVILAEYAGLNKGWNDPDMMVIGMAGIDHTMAKSHMALWCMMNSPIMLGFDLTDNAKWDTNKDIVLNTDFLGLNQDPLGVQSKRVYSSGSITDDPSTEYISSTNRIDVLAKPLADGDVALMFINCGSGSDGAKSASVDVDTIIDLIGHKMADGQNGSIFRNAKSYVITDLWSKDTSIANTGTFSVSSLGITDSYTIRIKPVPSGSKAGVSLLAHHLVGLAFIILIGFFAL